jgi:DNA polymerase-4/protein ImuB
VTLRRPAERWEPIFAELKRRLEATLPASALLDLTVELTALAARLDRQPLLLPDERQERAAYLAHELDQLGVRLGRPSVYRIVEVEPWSRLPERRHALLSCEPSTSPGRRGSA